jgi:uncharacterized protein
MHGAFAWNELATTDVEAARAFYSAVLDWTFEAFELPDGPYWVATSGETLVGGIGGMETAADPETTVPTWFAFIEVDDVDERVRRAVERGGSVVQAPHEVPG